MNKEILSALIGLAGAVANNGKTEDTDLIVKKALLCGEDLSLVDAIHKEKFRISPNCETCQTPCGNTSDYPLEKYEQWTKEQKLLKERVINELISVISNLADDIELPDFAYKVISYVGYDLQESSYLKLLEEMKAW